MSTRRKASQPAAHFKPDPVPTPKPSSAPDARSTRDVAAVVQAQAGLASAEALWKSLGRFSRLR